MDPKTPEIEKAGPVRILLVEDDPDDALMMHKYLQNAQTELAEYRLTGADRLEKAIALFKKQPYDLVILDLSLPDSRGIETFQRMREVAYTAAIVICSGLTDQKTAIEAIAQGAQDYIVKGKFDRPMLERRIQYALERRKIQLMKEEFIGMVTHDLRNPLAVSSEIVNQILEGFHGGVTPEQKKFLELARHAMTRLNRMVSDLLMMSKIELGRVKLNTIRMDMVHIADETAKSFGPIAESKGMKVILKGTQIPIGMQGDPDKLSQVWMNLVANALKYGKTGEVDLVVTDLGDQVECSVQDHGPGIATEDLSKLFRKFERLNNQSEGTGLGLAISKAIIEAHGGAIKAESSPGQGLKITFTLPKQSTENL